MAKWCACGAVDGDIEWHKSDVELKNWEGRRQARSTDKWQSDVGRKKTLNEINKKDSEINFTSVSMSYCRVKYSYVGAPHRADTREMKTRAGGSPHP